MWTRSASISWATVFAAISINFGTARAASAAAFPERVPDAISSLYRSIAYGTNSVAEKLAHRFRAAWPAIVPPRS